MPTSLQSRAEVDSSAHNDNFSVTRLSAMVVVSACIAMSLILFSATHAAQVKWDQETVLTVLRQEIDRIETMAEHPIILNAVSVQNAEKLSQTTIMQRDQVWIESGREAPFKQTMLASPASQYLRNIAIKNPSFTELLLLDNQGANIAVYPLTSDYWQGDEMKWQAIMRDQRTSYVGPMEYDVSSGLNSIQISLPVKQGNTTVGVIVVGVRLSHILSKQLRHSVIGAPHGNQ
ncbi:PDC sensor domain-containing protein [Pseudomaricurvus sp.]|uniref:PDC sensor domain-containing protein n=1 Tax=Pseudomaricurvus sp. TaxID=2004510 RepID=UPI003F6AC81A